MKRLLAGLFIALLFTSCLLFSANAAVPHLINYQGRLTDTSGTPLNGSYNITFRIYDAEAAGNLLWEETHANIQIQKSIFSIMLGSVTNLNLAFDKPYWLEIKVGTDAPMAPRQQITSAGYAIRAENSEQVGGKTTSDLVQIGQVAGGDLRGNYPNPSIADGTVSQAKLKTAVGEVSVTGGNAVYALPGGEYGFDIQFRGSSGNSGWIVKGCGVGGWNTTIPTSYTSTITAQMSSGTGYVRQRYITSSGKDHWVFLLVDKNTKDIISVYSAPDHPCYGNGGDPEKVPHPFASYDPAKYEIIILDKQTVAQLKQESKDKNKGFAELINEEYKPSMAKEEVYEPLHTGKFINKEPELIKTLPSYIKVRKLVKLNTQEIKR